MSKQRPVPSLQGQSPNIDTLLSNLRLLNLDRREDWPLSSPRALSANHDGPDHQARISCVEWVLYRLFEIWNIEETVNKLQPFFPPFEPLQSLNLRAALFRCLNQLKKDGKLRKDISLRKTMFDDCKGDSVLRLMANFSTAVLRNVSGKIIEGKGSTTRGICVAEAPSLGDRKSLLPLAIAHQANLRKILQRKDDLRARYKDFGHILDVKDRELDRKFEKVVETQQHLDKNIASEATVARIAKQLDLHFQGDRRNIDVIAQGEEMTTTDILLDTPFEDIWPSVSDGTYVPEITSSRHGLLEELDKRVEFQIARLRKWRELKAQMLNHTKPVSPAKKSDGSSPGKVLSPYRGKEKDLVLSPRKSPRKSDLPISRSPTAPPCTSLPLSRDRQTPDISSMTKQQSDNDDSGFSGVGRQDPTICSSSSSLLRDANSNRRDIPNNLNIIPRDGTKDSNVDEAAACDTQRGSVPSSRPISHAQNNASEEADLAERITLQTLNTDSTSIKAPVSLIERTRQSMAQASPGAKLSSQMLPPSLGAPAAARAQSLEESVSLNPKLTLVERTRQSISLVPAKSKAPRGSLSGRRNSKIYPTNQFETPRRFGTVKEITPPDELFSPGAGYDSVFKSRPKVGFSPTSTPEQISSGSDDVGPGVAHAGNHTSLEESPLARLVAKA